MKPELRGKLLLNPELIPADTQDNLSIDITEKEETPFSEEWDFKPNPLESEEIQGKESTEVLPVISKKIIEKVKKYINSYFLEKNRVPSMNWISSKINVSKSVISNSLQLLESEKFLFRKGNRFYLSQNPEEIPGLTLNRVKATVKVSPGIFAVKVILFLIGIGATYMSIFHSRDMLLDYYNPIRATISAIIMIGFNILAAEMAIFFFTKGYKAICGVFAILLVLGTLFSMGSTIYGLYNKRAAVELVEISEENDFNIVFQSSTLLYQNILDRKEQARQDYESERIKRDDYVQKLSTYNTPEIIEENQTYFDSLTNSRWVADKRVDKARRVYEEIITEEKVFLESQSKSVVAPKKEDPPNAYDWLGELVFTGVSPDRIQFWASAYPALFYDVIAPVSFGVVLFVTGERKKKKLPKKRRKSRANK